MRIRTIKPEFWTHPIMARMAAPTQLLALALLSHADDEGYFRADPAIVRGACAPFREDLATIREDLARLVEVGWIELGRHPEHGIIGWFPSWTKHQKVDHPKQSKIRGYCETKRFAKASRKPRDELALDQGSGIRDQGAGNREQNREDIAPPPPLLAHGDLTQPDTAAGNPRKHTLGDLQAVHSTLVVFRDDRDTAETMLALYGWEACNRALAELTPAAKLRGHGKQRVTISEMRQWLAGHYDLEPEDYKRVGIDVPTPRPKAKP